MSKPKDAFEADIVQQRIAIDRELREGVEDELVDALARDGNGYFVEHAAEAETVDDLDCEPAGTGTLQDQLNMICELQKSIISNAQDGQAKVDLDDDDDYSVWFESNSDDENAAERATRTAPESLKRKQEEIEAIEDAHRRLHDLSIAHLWKPVGLLGLGSPRPDGPPRGAKFLLLLVPKNHREVALGDLEEEYRTVLLPEYGAHWARFYYWWHALISLGFFVLGSLQKLSRAFSRN